MTDIAHRDPAQDANDELRVGLARLTDRQRSAVLYHHVAGFSYAEIADLIGTTEAAARRSAADGMAKLRALYDRGAPT